MSICSNHLLEAQNEQIVDVYQCSPGIANPNRGAGLKMINSALRKATLMSNTPSQLWLLHQNSFIEITSSHVLKLLLSDLH